MDKGAAEGAASMILLAIGALVRLFRPDRTIVPPTAQERESLARGIQIMSHRRANWMGAADDIILIMFALGGYTARAIRAPGAT